MPDISTLGITTKDGKAVIYDAAAPWKIWSLSEIYRGPQTVGAVYVPKVNDYVKDIETNTDYIVRNLDPVTLIPTLIEKRPGNLTYVMSETDVLFGVGPGTPADIYRVYYDDSVMPATCTVDTHCTIQGTMCQYVKVFKGADTSSSTGHVIGQIFDANKNFVTNNIPLELVQIDNHTNFATKIVSTFNISEELEDGELVTVVAYSSNGHVVSKRQCLIYKSAFIRSLNVSRRYITSINLLSPFLSPTNDHVINYPLNVPMDAMNLTGVVNYSDGSKVEYEVNGTKFDLLGMDQFISTIPYQKLELVLRYTLAEDEIAYTGVSSDGVFITEQYSLVTTDVNNSYNVKLYCYPVWVEATQNYRLNWYLYNLDRNISINVSPYVQFSDNTGSFNPTAFNVLQRKSVRLNLRDVSGSFKAYIHTQLVDIVLKSPPNGRVTPWVVSHVADASRESYGTDMVAVQSASQPTVAFTISANATSMENWLEKTYYRIVPLVDRINEIDPPKPTHFEVSYGSASKTYSLASWNTEINLGIETFIYKNISIKFLNKSGTSTQKLGVVEMMLVP